MGVAFSNYLEAQLLNASLKGVPFSVPVVYIALFSGDPTEDGTGPELSGGSYTRQAINFGNVANGAVANSSDINFPRATSSWATITHVALFDGSIGGNMLYYGPIDVPKTVNNGDQFKFFTGDVTITLD